MTILEKIITSKIEEVKILKKLYSYNEVEKRFFFNRKTKSLKRRLELSNHGIIAEHKRKSPSKSVINSNVKLDEVILGYDMANVCGISVLTDKKYFGGSINDLVKARELTEIPIIRKEFIIDEFQDFLMSDIALEFISSFSSRRTRFFGDHINQSITESEIQLKDFFNETTFKPILFNFGLKL